MEHVGTSPRLVARIAGAFYLLTISGGIFAEYVLGTFIVSGNPTATVQNILASETLYRWSVAGNLVSGASYIVVTVLLYRLLAPVNKTVALLATLFSVVGVAMWCVSALLQLVPLLAAQLPAITSLMLKLRAQGSILSGLFFGPYCVLVGYLVFKSTYLPRMVGVLMILAGVCYIVNTVASVLSPAVANALSSFILYPGLLGEGGLTLWLLVMGLNVERYRSYGESSI